MSQVEGESKYSNFKRIAVRGVGIAGIALATACGAGHTSADKNLTPPLPGRQPIAIDCKTLGTRTSDIIGGKDGQMIATPLGRIIELGNQFYLEEAVDPKTMELKAGTVQNIKIANNSRLTAKKDIATYVGPNTVVAYQLVSLHTGDAFNPLAPTHLVNITANCPPQGK